MHGNGYLEASGQKPDPFAPATSISCNRGITLVSVYIFPVILQVL